MKSRENIESYVREAMIHHDAGHDYTHTDRVRKIALVIATSSEFSFLSPRDLELIEITALLHDVGDEKFYSGSLKKRDKALLDLLSEHGYSEGESHRVILIIKNISYSGGNNQKLDDPIFEIVQDADRIEALGAIGIARTFHYGGLKGHKMHDSSIKPRKHMSKKEYRNKESTTINHFYEKLLKLKDLMNTVRGREIAEERHLFMEKFLAQFYAEWNVEISEYESKSK